MRTSAAIRQILELPSFHPMTKPYHLSSYNSYTSYLYLYIHYVVLHSNHFHLYHIGCMKPSTQVPLGLDQ